MEFQSIEKFHTWKKALQKRGLKNHRGQDKAFDFRPKVCYSKNRKKSMHSLFDLENTEENT